MALQRIDDFDQAYFQTVIGACFQAIVRTTLDGESERLRPTEIRAALAHVLGMVAATTDARAAQDPRALAEQLAAEFLDSFRTTRESLDVGGAAAEPRSRVPRERGSFGPARSLGMTALSGGR